jgi:hypothetical protein
MLEEGEEEVLFKERQVAQVAQVAELQELQEMVRMLQPTLEGVVPEEVTHLFKDQVETVVLVS